MCSITPELPIDIVYTWVNGSDPDLLEGLNRLKNELLKKEKKKEQEKKEKEKKELVHKHLTTMYE